MSSRLSSLLLVCTLSSGCEVEPNPGDTEEETSEQTQDSEPEDTTPSPYRYVRVDDTVGGDASGDAPGADIDAVVLSKADGGGDLPVTEVPDASVDGGADSSVVLDHVSSADGYGISLGGGGYVVVGFGDAEVEVGDTITVYEVCTGDDDDRVALQISVSAEVEGPWDLVDSYDGSGSQDHTITVTVE